MLFKNGGLQSRIEWLIMYFIVLQPILDVTNSFFSNSPHLGSTMGILVRIFAMILSFGYIFHRSREKENKKFLYYFLLLGIVVLTQLVINIFTKHPIHIVDEIRFLSKTIYFPIMLITYILVFSSLRKKVDIGVKKYITYAMIITGLIMVVSTLTSTNYPTYDYSSVGLVIGSTGWFFAGNELGSFLAICFPIVLLSSIKNTTSFAKLYHWIPVVLMVFSLISIGTKVGYGSLILVLLIGLFMCWKEAFASKKNNEIKVNNFSLNIGIIFSLIVLCAAVLPYAPITKSTNVSLQKAGFAEGYQSKYQKEQVSSGVEDLNDAGVTSLLFSGRNKFLSKKVAIFENAPISQKLFGMGYGGNSGEKPSTVERDFHDIFFNFGFIGFILIVLPIVYYVLQMSIVFYSNLKNMFSLHYVLTASSVALGLGISFLAGHVLTAPAVSIYVVFVMAYLVTALEIEK